MGVEQPHRDVGTTTKAWRCGVTGMISEGEWDCRCDNIHCETGEWVAVVPDTVVQAVKDGEDCEHGNVAQHIINGYSMHDCIDSDEIEHQWCEGSPKWRAAIQALKETANGS